MPEEFQLLEEWKKILNLNDWFITLKYPCDDDDMMEDADGDVEYVESTRCALIRICNPETRKDGLRPFDFESVLVHELLHCKMSLLGNGEDWDKNLRMRVLHQMIDDLAISFVEAKRKGLESKTKKEKG